MEIILLWLAVIPVLALCFYIYIKDQHKEPIGLLFKLFIFGAISCIPVIICELLFGIVFDTEDGTLPFILIFINVFFGVALIEEGFKWLIAYFFGYKSREFDEVYDIIVYAGFASLGFACIENIFYVLESGVGTAILRALMSIPGHACFGILMGYYLSKAKVNEMNGKKGSAGKNMFLSILIPTLFHTAYDALLTTENEILFFSFFLFDLIMVIYCFILVHKMSKVQQNITTNVTAGNLTANNGVIVYNAPNNSGEIHYCPLCGTHVDGYNYCPYCGFKVK